MWHILVFIYIYTRIRTVSRCRPWQLKSYIGISNKMQQYQVIGNYYTDIIYVGDVTMKDQWFGNGDVPKSLFDGNLWPGIFGLGSEYGEAMLVNPASPWFGDWSKRYEPLWKRLSGNGVVGVWLNWQGGEGGEVGFGGVDLGRAEGELVSKCDCNPILDLEYCEF